MRNAKKELLEEIKDLKIKCVYIQVEEWVTGNINYILPLNYTNEQYDKFIESLDFEYDAGYGGQELYGNVWFENGTWLERGEYDGSEWWEHKVIPEIPKECN